MKFGHTIKYTTYDECSKLFLTLFRLPETSSRSFYFFDKILLADVYYFYYFDNLLLADVYYF